MSVTNLDRRLNHIDSEGTLVSNQISDARRDGWPDFAIVPLLKIRAKLRREWEYVSGLKNKG